MPATLRTANLTDLKCTELTDNKLIITRGLLICVTLARLDSTCQTALSRKSLRLT